VSGDAPTADPPQESYYGRPIINPPVWEEREIAGYLFCGGLAGASSILAAAADASARPHLASRARLCASAAVTVSFVALIKDLGRPERFVNMLRVLKPTSPMSVGTWILSAYAPLNYLASATTVARRAPLVGRAAGVGAGLLGSAVASYTAALIADTAVPAWHEGYRELPFLFASSAAAAAGGFGLVAAPVVENAPAARMALLGSAGELIAERLLERRLGPIAQTLRTGVAGRRMRTATLLSTAGLFVSATGACRSRAGAALTGAALLTASALTRFGLFAAGMESARDPRYTVQLQRDRAEAKVTLDVYPAADRAA
jgi:formate-dependent nitrite reductase membrane component NrfD